MSELPTTVTSSYQLSIADRAFFRRNGFVQLHQMLDPDELHAFDPVITNKVIELNSQDQPLAERDTYGKAFLQVTNLWTHDARVERFVRSPDLARLAAELLEVQSVRLYHDQALYKEPGGGITPWHADQYYWPFSTDRCVTVWIPLQDTPMDLGPLSFAAGSHTADLGRSLPISDESEKQIADAMLEQGFVTHAQPYQLGDASFHLGWTFHRAGANESDLPRRVMTIIYVDADMVISEPANEPQQTDLEVWLPGCRPGDTVSSELNPVLHSP